MYVYRAPEGCRAVDSTAAGGADPSADEGEEEGEDVTHDVVAPFKGFELLSVIFAEDGQVDVDSHREVPEGVRGEEHGEPVSYGGLWVGEKGLHLD